jgi:hypothetical protein
VEGALFVEASVPPFLLRVVLRVFSSSLLSLRLYTGCRARQRTPGRRGEHVSPFALIIRMCTLPLYLGRGDPQEKH